MYFLEYTQYHTRCTGTQPGSDSSENQGYRYYDDWKVGCNLYTIAEVGTDVKQVDEVFALRKDGGVLPEDPGSGQRGEYTGACDDRAYFLTDEKK